MISKEINRIELTVTGVISNDELTLYLTQLQIKTKGKIISAEVTVDGDFVDINIIVKPLPFERIRRITGYLVGTTAKWCDSKKAELRDRVVHGQRITQQP